MMAAKGLTRAIRRAGRGGGTALPGLVATKIDPDLLDKLAARLPAGTIVVAGTNGKTTTSRMLADVLGQSGLKVAHNRSGSNLERGIAGALIEQLPLNGQAPDIGVIEVDENAFPTVVRRVQPRVVLLLNLFRDQLDRYGELETIAARWRPAISELSADSTLVVNADDPLLAALAEAAPGRVVRFGFSTEGNALPELPHAADAGYCRRCGERLDYRAIYLSHLGDYVCPTCGAERGPLDVTISQVESEGLNAQRLIVDRAAGPTLDVTVAVPGLYNAYNALAVIATSGATGLVPDEAIQAGLGQFQPAFGRLERLDYQGRNLTLALSKNPVGFNELLRMLATTREVDLLGIAINDLDADGRDVSWLWDVDFEQLQAEWFDGQVIVGGIRGDDMAVRLRYAGLDPARIDGLASGEPLEVFLERLVQRSEPGERVFLLLTYTALLQLRQVLADQGAVSNFWEQ